MYPNTIHFESLCAALNSINRIPYIKPEPTTTTVGLAAMGAYSRTIVVEETFLSHGMSGPGTLIRSGAVLIRLNALVERIIASQLEHANTYRGQS